ncbi:type II and III secretion system protein family protein [Thermaurantiacus sp.]
MRLSLLPLLALAALAAPAPAVEVGRTAGAVDVEIGKGRLMRLDRPAAGLFVADPAIADVQVRSPTLFYLFGRAPGETSLFAVDSANRPVTALDVRVGYDTALLLAAFERNLPGRQLSASTVGDSLLLGGQVETAAEADDAVRLALRFVPGGDPARIINRIRVSRPTQIALKVRVVEISRDITRALGFNWEMAGTLGDVTLGMVTGNPLRGVGGAIARPAGASTIFGAFNGQNLDVTGAIDVLDRQGLVTVLAEPTLTAVSGAPASFLAGGEYPIPVPQEGNVTTIEYKRFGVSLTFVATIGAGERIHLKVEPEVSQLSSAGAINFNGIDVPALTVRRIETAVELGSGQSFAIAGLIQSAATAELKKFAGLGDIPVIGQLLRSRKFENKETELVVVVTPYLVRPVGPGALADPQAEGRLK